MQLTKIHFLLRVIFHTVAQAGVLIGDMVRAKIRRSRARLPSEPLDDAHNIVVIGASFAGYPAASFIASLLPPDSRYRVVVIEPNSHLHLTWVLPRFCVTEGHEDRAFIPYSNFLNGVPDWRIKWIRDRAISVDRRVVRLRDGSEIPYEYLIITTGASSGGALPSRVDAECKENGMALLKNMQQQIKTAKNLVVVGGGAAGVELATDAKSVYPEKTVTLIHSRPAFMHRFGPELQAAALDGLQKLGVVTILGDRVLNDEPVDGFVTTKLGQKIQCDKLVKCVGQKPSSSILADLSPNAILPSGYIAVRPTLQVADDSLPNIYACGDVADTATPNPNARAAFAQSIVVAHNIVSAIEGKKPDRAYEPDWLLAMIKLTLGLDRSVTQLGDSETELLFDSKEKDVDPISANAWKHLGAVPFEDPTTVKSS